MNLGKIITRVQREHGDESEAEISRSDIIDWANEGQIEIVKKTKCLGDHKETAVNSGQAAYLLPPETIFLDRVTYRGVPLTPVTQEFVDTFIKEKDRDNPTGTPDSYYVYGRELILHPAPNESGGGLLDIWYTRVPTTLVGDSDIPEIPEYLHRNIIEYAKAKAKAMDEETDVSERIMGNLDLNLSQDRDDVNSLQDDSYPAVRALPGDY